MENHLRLPWKQAYEAPGIMINSAQFDGVKSQEGKDRVIEFLKEINSGDFKINYKLRDWLISRQRYWGAPIPIVYCEKCGESGLFLKRIYQFCFLKR